jgi:hypothetical protein
MSYHSFKSLQQRLLNDPFVELWLEHVQLEHEEELAQEPIISQEEINGDLAPEFVLSESIVELVF